MDTPTLEELQRTRTELDSRVNSLQLAMDNLRNEMNLYDRDNDVEEADDGTIVESQDDEEPAVAQAMDGERRRANRRSLSASQMIEPNVLVELPASSSTLYSGPRPFDPVRLHRGQVSLLDSPPTPSNVELLATTEFRPPPSADELDRSYRSFIQERLTLSPLPGLSSAIDGETPYPSSPSSPSTPFPLNESDATRSQLHHSHFQPRRVLRSFSGIDSDSNSEYHRPNLTSRFSSSISASTSAFTTRRTSADRLSNRNLAMTTQSAEEMLERVDETAMDLMDVRTSLQERSQSIRDSNEVSRMRILNETLRNGVNLIDQLEGRLGVVRNRLASLTPSRRRGSTSSVHVDVLPAPPRSFSIRPPQLRRGEFPRLEVSSPPSSNSEFNRMNGREEQEQVLFSASPDPIHSVPPTFSSRPDTFSDWVTSRGVPTSVPAVTHNSSSFTSINPNTSSATPSAVAITDTTNSSPLSNPASLPDDSSQIPNRHRLLFNTSMAYASPSSTAAASDRMTMMDPASQFQEVRDRNNYMWRGGDDGISFGEEIGGLRRSGWAERVIGSLGRRARQDRGARRNRPWDLEGHGVSERGDEDWPELTEAGNQSTADEDSSYNSHNFDAPRDLSRTNLFVRSASEDPTLTVSLPNQTLRRELLLSGQASFPSLTQQGDQESSAQYQTLPPLTLSSSRSLYNAPFYSNLSDIPSSNLPVRLPARQFEIHSFPDRFSTDPPNPLVVADRIHEDILLCEHRRIVAEAEAQRKKDEDEKKAATEIIDWMQCEGDYGEESEEEWVVRPGPVELPHPWVEPLSITRSRRQKPKPEERGVKRRGEEMKRGGAKVVLIETGSFVGR